MRFAVTVRFLYSLLPLGLGASFAASRPELVPHRVSAGTLVVRVLDAASKAPIPNAQVTDIDVSVQRLTTAVGEARFGWGDRPVAHVRVRQLGYRFAERTVLRGAGDADTATFALVRIPFVLPERRAEALDNCGLRTDSATQELSLVALSTLRLAAEHFDEFRRIYPFTMRAERRTITFSRRPLAPPRETLSREHMSSDRWGEGYRPGGVLHREPLGFSVSLLFVNSLADSSFWDRHCLVARAVESRDGQRWLRLEFAPARNVDSPDWSGSAWLDSATSVLRRIEFRLTGLGENDSPRRLEGYTTFSAPSPFITIPDSSVAYWWRTGPRTESEWGKPDVLQLIRVTAIEYSGATPPP